ATGRSRPLGGALLERAESGEGRRATEGGRAVRGAVQGGPVDLLLPHSTNTCGRGRDAQCRRRRRRRRRRQLVPRVGSSGQDRNERRALPARRGTSHGGPAARGG